MKTKTSILALSKAFFILLVMCCFSCQHRDKIYRKRTFQVFLSEDNNWTTSGEYSCDSIRFKNKNEAVIWIDGKPMTIYSKLIKVFQNK